jgi:hypothetical protein
MNATTEETQAPSAATTDATASAQPSNEAPAQVDFNRLIDDPEYAEQVERDQAAASDAPTEPTETAAPAPTVPAAGQDDDPIIETIIVEGREESVRKSQAKPLLQKGRYMERRFERASHLLSLERDAPDVAEMLKTPDGRRRALELLRSSKTPAPAPAAEQVLDADGDPIRTDDLALVDQRAEVKARELLARAGITVPDQADLERETAARETAGRRVAATIEALRDTDPEYDSTITAVRELIAEVQRTQPPEKAAAFLRAIDDPRNINPESGKPLFVHLYHDARRWALSRKAGAAAPAGAAAGPASAPAATTTTTRTAPRNITATLEPGSPAPRSAPGRAAGSPDFASMSAQDRLVYFNRLVDSA